MQHLPKIFLFASVLCLVSCKQQSSAPSKPDLASLTDDFVYGSLALSPTAATQAGYHQHKGANLDEQLDDFSPAGIDQQHKFYSDFHQRLAGIQQASLSAEDKADLRSSTIKSTCRCSNWTRFRAISTTRQFT